MSRLGSPPRVRGKGNTVEILDWTGRITPACAGKSIIRRTFFRFLEDHPRVCGEKFAPDYLDITATGSPPRVRGKVLRILRHRNSAGITPACAGKSTIPVAGFPTGGDHPRVCGEKSKRVNSTKRIEGSPPRVRGKAGLPFSSCSKIGITPACAGKSTAGVPVRRRSRDHPRVCGEKS